MSEWHSIPLFPAYAVSIDGRVCGARGRELKTTVNQGGYKVCDIHGTQQRVNRLVCRVFHGPSPTVHHVAAHKDGNRLNNHADNLYWATPNENSDDMIRHGTVPLGEAHKSAKITEKDVRLMRDKHSNGMKIMHIWKEYFQGRICYATVSHVCHRRVWKHI